jgi:type I restriction enzyme M protein
LPKGVFSQTGAGVKTNLMFFNNNGETGEVWYYDLSHVHVTKKQPLTKAHFEEFFKLLPKRKEGENSWRVSAEAIAANGYNLRAINPNKKVETDTRTPAQLAKIIRDQNQKIDAALNVLDSLTL